MCYMFQWCFKTLLSVVILNKILMHRQCSIRDFPGGSIVKNPLANAGDMGSTPGSGISPGEGNGNSSILAWEIPWREEPSGLHSMWFDEVHAFLFNKNTNKKVTISRLGLDL